jgi:hypothetical protein
MSELRRVQINGGGCYYVYGADKDDGVLTLMSFPSLAEAAGEAREMTVKSKRETLVFNLIGKWSFEDVSPKFIRNQENRGEDV